MGRASREPEVVCGGVTTGEGSAGQVPTSGSSYWIVLAGTDADADWTLALQGDVDADAWTGEANSSYSAEADVDGEPLPDHCGGSGEFEMTREQ